MYHVNVNTTNTVCAKYIYIWNPATCICKNGKYLAGIIDDPVITYDEIIYAVAKSFNEETKTVLTNLNEKNITCKTKNSYILLDLLLINYSSIIDNCYYLLLPNKISSKIKAFFAISHHK